MLLALLFLVVYLLPVLPVARRIHYVRTLPTPKGKARNLPHRVITKSPFRNPGSKYTYINEVIIDKKDVCQNCGGSNNNHEGGAFWSLGQTDQKRHAACNNFKRWDGKRSDWPKRTIDAPLVPQTASISSSMVLGLFWPYFVSAEVSKRAYYAVEPDWSNFAVEYKGAETKAQKIERLQREVEAANARTDRILEGVDKVKTQEELDALVS